MPELQLEPRGRFRPCTSTRVCACACFGPIPSRCPKVGVRELISAGGAGPVDASLVLPAAPEPLVTLPLVLVQVSQSISVLRDERMPSSPKRKPCSCDTCCTPCSCASTPSVGMASGPAGYSTSREDCRSFHHVDMKPNPHPGACSAERVTAASSSSASGRAGSGGGARPGSPSVPSATNVPVERG